MKILVVNDDSINASGIALLAKAAMKFGDVTVVAPAQQCSAMSQKLTIRGELRVERAEDFPVPVKAAYKVDGTPVDCVKVALHYILKEKPDYVFSGINDGYNVGFDIAYSGTLGAAFEAVMHGIPAMAFSSTMHAPMDIAEAYMEPVIQELLEAELKPGEVWNVNFPSVDPSDFKGILKDRPVAGFPVYQEKYIPTIHSNGSVSLEISGHPLPEEDGIPDGTDVDAVMHGYISIGKVKSVVL